MTDNKDALANTVGLSWLANNMKERIVNVFNRSIKKTILQDTHYFLIIASLSLYFESNKWIQVKSRQHFLCFDSFYSGSHLTLRLVPTHFMLTLVSHYWQVFHWGFCFPLGDSKTKSDIDNCHQGVAVPFYSGMLGWGMSYVTAPSPHEGRGCL